jgi:cytoskeletal protein RodZ
MTELGKFLVEKRQEKNISLDELQAITKIQKRYLVAVEQGNYELLPGKFYARAFIKTYSEAIGVSPTYVFDTYSADLPTTVEKNAHEGLSRAKKKSQSTVADSKWFAVLPKVLLVCLILGLAASYWVYYQKFNNEPQQQNSEEDNNFVDYENGKSESDQDEQENEEDTPAEPDTSVEEDVQEEPKFTITMTKSNGEDFHYDLVNSEKLAVSITFNGDCYVKIRNGKGHVFLKGTYKKGDVIEDDFSAEELLVMRFGATQQVNMLINGEPFVFDSEKTVQNILITNK